MYIDLIHYRLADGITENHLRSVAERIHSDWMKHIPGFVRWEIHKREDGTFTDFVYWESREASQASEERSADIPNADEWYACYAFESIQSTKLQSVALF